jgi:hypothetical protein
MLSRCQCLLFTGPEGCMAPARWLLTAGPIQAEVCRRHLARQAEIMSWRGGERVTLGLVPIEEPG